jgi:hypothetical protein
MPDMFLTSPNFHFNHTLQYQFHEILLTYLFSDVKQ